MTDRATRLQSVPDDLGLSSEWLNGPAYLKTPIKEWPVNRDFADKKSTVKLPMKEIRKLYREQLLGKQEDTAVIITSAGVVIVAGTKGGDILFPLQSRQYLVTDMVVGS